MRDIKQLLDVLLDEYQHNPDDKIRSLGLCFAVKRLCYYNLINLHEKDGLLYVIKANRPTDVGNAFWWHQGEVEPRVEFLKQLISKLENETWLDKLKRKLGL